MARRINESNTRLLKRLADSVESGIDIERIQNIIGSIPFQPTFSITIKESEIVIAEIDDLEIRLLYNTFVTELHHMARNLHPQMNVHEFSQIVKAIGMCAIIIDRIRNSDFKSLGKSNNIKISESRVNAAVKVIKIHFGK